MSVFYIKFIKKVVFLKFISYITIRRAKKMAFIDKSIIDEIKSKNDIVDVIGSYISLNDKNKALCPFHDDHSPSFSVQKDKQIYKCFSCGESGNVITFVKKYNGITFTEALKMLADRAGIPLNVSTTRKINTKYEKLYEIIPYSRLNTIISNCPNGLPFALKINDVTPIRDAHRVK